MNIIDRIKTIMEKESIKSDKEFAEIINIEQKTVWNYLNNRRKPSLEFISKIIAVYPYINLYWLLTGEGNMENINTSTDNSSNEFVSYLKEQVSDMKSIIYKKTMEISNLKEEIGRLKGILETNNVQYKQTGT